MGAKAWVWVAAAAWVFLAGCTTSQERQPLGYEVDLQRERQLHGDYGDDMARLFNTGKIAQARQDSTGNDRGLILSEFYQVQIAPNPAEPTLLAKVGYVRKLEQDRSTAFYYEFYDGGWARIGRLSPDGALYRLQNGSESYVGSFHLASAVLALYPAPSGYGYDRVTQDLTRVRMHDPEVNMLDQRRRGVWHTTHASAPPVVNFALYRRGEAGALAGQYNSVLYAERENLKLEQLRDRRLGGVGMDEEYGGLRYLNGNPVDENGKPLRPGSLAK